MLIKHRVLKNIKALFWFELIYKSVMMAFGVPLIKAIINGTIWMTGFRYLTLENIRRFLRHPLTILITILILLVLAVYELIEVLVIIYLTDQSYLGRDAHSRSAFRFALKQAGKLLRPKNIAMLIIIMMMIPVMNIGIFSAAVSMTAIPQMLLDRINGSYRNIVIFYGLILIILIILTRFMYALHYFAVEGYTFNTAMDLSRNISKRSHIKDLFRMAVRQLILLLSFALVCGGGIFLIIIVQMNLAEKRLLGMVISTLIAVFTGAVAAVFTAVSFPLCYTLVCRMYYEKKDLAGEQIRRTYEAEPDPDSRSRKLFNYLTALVLITTIVISSLYLYGTSRGKYNLQIERIKTMSVSAHRGASAYYPENTMAAFHGAYEQGADWIELDVHQSKDEQVFVMHDDSFKRTAGLARKAWELSWDEIEKLDAGGWFSSEFAGEQFVLLRDVIDYAKFVGIRLNIELKPSVYEDGLPDRVVDIVKEEGFEDNCVITSQNYAALERIKEYEPGIKTVYVMGLAAGRIERLDAADNFSIESSFVTRRLVTRLHNQGKEIYAWTVNSRKTINRMIDLGVDNIITDNIPMAKQCVNESRAGDLLIDYVYTIMDLLQ